LAAPKYAHRQAAEQEIFTLGVAGKQQLEAAAQSSDPELRLRAQRLLKQLKREALWQGSTVSLVADKIKASAAVRAVSEQTGNDLAVGDQYGTFADADIGLQHPESLFWRAVDDVCRKSKNRVRARYGSGKPGLVCVSGHLGQFPVAYQGPVRGQLTSAKRVFVEEFDYENRASETTHTFQLNLVMSWEDRFRLVAYQSHLSVAEAATDRPIRLVDHKPAESGWQVVDKSSRQHTTSLRIQPPPQTANKLGRLTLHWDLIAVGDMQTLEVTDLKPDVEHRAEDLGILINETDNPSGTRWELTVALSRDLVVPEPEEVLFVENEFELYDQDQQAFSGQGVSRLGITNGAARMKLSFVAPSSESVPTRLVVRYPRIRDGRTLAVTFHDVPLPCALPE
jgi:hypothetical protein